MPKDHSLNIMVDQRTLAELQSIAKDLGVTMAHVVRTLIHNAASMRFRNTPACADGQRCFVPHMHAAPKPQEEPTSNA